MTDRREDNVEEESLIRISDRLSRNRRSGRWFGADLHVHTKDSHDVSSTASENAEEFIKAFFDAGIAIVAVTDHSTGEYVDKAIEAAALTCPLKRYQGLY